MRKFSLFLMLLIAHPTFSQQMKSINDLLSKIKDTTLERKFKEINVTKPIDSDIINALYTHFVKIEMSEYLQNTNDTSFFLSPKQFDTANIPTQNIKRYNAINAVATLYKSYNTTVQKWRNSQIDSIITSYNFLLEKKGLTEFANGTDLQIDWIAKVCSWFKPIINDYFLVQKEVNSTPQIFTKKEIEVKKLKYKKPIQIKYLSSLEPKPEK